MENPSVELCFNKAKIDLLQLQYLMNVAAFWARDRDIADLRIAVANSDPVISAWDGDRLVGFSRATSDGVYRAVLWDVIVHPEYQSIGLGRRLMETVFNHPLIGGVERLYLMTTNQQEFYRQLGFQNNWTTTMVCCRSDLIQQPALGFIPVQRLVDTLPI